jgi:SpoVK/Ycf46/Vps4 family AAA+-type ATPase
LNVVHEFLLDIFIKDVLKSSLKFSPTFLFIIDEFDSLLTSRRENENEARRRIKTEFLV